MMKWPLRYCVVLSVALFAACAGVGPQRGAETAPPFELAGRIVVRYQESGFTSSIRWKQSAGRDEIWLTAPLGQTIAHLEADGSGATLTASDQKQYRASSIESLTKSAFGWRFPVDGLRYWLFGEAMPGALPGSIERDDSKRISRLKQDDWQIVFNYPSAEATRPSRLDIAGNDAQIRLAIDTLSRQAP